MIALALLATLSLGDAQALALSRAPAVAEARARADETRALARAARGQGVPHAVVNYSQAPQAGVTNNTVLQKLTTYAGAVTLGDLFGRDPAIAQADAALRSAQASEIDAERAERIKVIGLFIDFQRARETERLRLLLVAAALADQHAANLRYASGDAPHLDVVRADVALAQARADFAQAQADTRNALNALAVETGVDPATLDAPRLPTAVPPGTAGVSDAMLNGRVDYALEHRPEISAARNDVTSEAAALRSARLGGVPAITAQAGYTTGVDTAVNVKGPSANVTLDLPIGGASAAQVAAQRARVDEARARLAAAIQSVKLDVSSALVSLGAAQEATQSTALASAEAQAEVTATQVGYASGASSSLELIDARRAFAQAQLADLEARATFFEDQDVLNLALGVLP